MDVPSVSPAWSCCRSLRLDVFPLDGIDCNVTASSTAVTMKDDGRILVIDIAVATTTIAYRRLLCRSKRGRHPHHHAGERYLILMAKALYKTAGNQLIVWHTYS